MKNNRIVDRPLQISEPTFLPEQSHRVDAELKLNLPLDETDGDVTSAPQTAATPHMTSGTLPFGGAWESGGGVGGGTSRSNVTDASAIADELRGVVRAELKKLVEVRPPPSLPRLKTCLYLQHFRTHCSLHYFVLSC